MSNKEELMHLIDVLPSKKLDNLLNYAKELEKTEDQPVDLSKYLDKILTENAEVLKRLAK